MKFAKYLEENSVPEWRSQYVDYRQLKKLIKQVVKARHREKQPKVSVPILEDDENKEKEEETDDNPPYGSDEVLYHQPSSLKLRSRSSLSTKSASDERIKEEQDFLMALEENQLTGEEMDFFKRLDFELRKADKFFNVREEQAWKRLEDLSRQCDILSHNNQIGVALGEQGVIRLESSPVDGEGNLMQDGKDRNETNARYQITEQEPEASDEDPNSREAENFTPVAKNPKQRLQKAFLEFYRLLELLKNFRIINQTSLAKILKKFEKTTGTNGDWYSARAKELHIFKSRRIEEMITLSETLYTANFAAGNRHKAMRSLRIPDVKADLGLKNWRTGLLIGLSIPAIVSSLRHIFGNGFPDKNVQLIFLVFAGFSIPILFLFMYALLLVIWQRYHVNWVLVFELDPRDYMPAEAVSDFASVLLLLFSYTMYLAMTENLLSFISTKWYPSILLFIILFILLNPFDVFYRSSRAWFAKTLFRIIVSGVYTVQFRDFFITDLLSSMTYMFVSMQTLVCSAVHDLDDLERDCSFSTSWVVPFITALPALWRLLQCIRRYYDSKLLHPHISNALKYCLSLSVIFFSAAARITGSDAARIFWIISAIFASMYAYSWDVLFDWGLLQRHGKNRWLRNVLVYPKWVYVSAIGLNFVLRLSWVFLLSPNNWGLFQDARVLVYLQALVELFRRFVWSVLRMENEHTNNIGKFRAVAEVPLPFRVELIPVPREEDIALRRIPSAPPPSPKSMMSVLPSLESRSAAHSPRLSARNVVQAHHHSPRLSEL